jgi:tRNA-2-methylthio-N6-dimethylallyladenosine synthase
VARKYLIETYGCQMNVHDSERMAGLLEQAGFEATTDDADADVIVINTCSVRERAEEKLFTRLGELREMSAEIGRDPIVAVAGCVAQQEGAAIHRRAPGVADIVVGTQAIRRLPMLVGDRSGDGSRRRRPPVVDLDPCDDVTWPLGITRRSDPVKAYITIIEGCNEFCSFCVVPYTRGHERMRPKTDILAEVREAAGSGRREVQLLGQIVNHYEAPDDPACDFTGLLEAIHEVPGIERIRFASPHPRHFSRRFLAAMTRLPKICRHLHLPVQSGSTRVLAAMRRRYTRESYLELVTAIREMTRRIVALQTLQRRIQTELNAALVGREVEVLVDAASRRRDTELSGRTSGNTVVNFPGPASWIGRTVRIRVARAGAHSVWGRAVAPDGTDEAVVDSAVSGA